jgi:hypothetical protein
MSLPTSTLAAGWNANLRATVNQGVFAYLRQEVEPAYDIGDPSRPERKGRYAIGKCWLQPRVSS